MVPNNSAARLLIFLNFSLPTRLIWTYTLIKFQEKILPTLLLCTYTVIAQLVMEGLELWQKNSEFFVQKSVIS